MIMNLDKERRICIKSKTPKLVQTNVPKQYGKEGQQILTTNFRSLKC